MPRLIRVTTVPLSLSVLLRNQMRYMKERGFEVIMVSADGKEIPSVVANEQCTHIIIPMTRQITPFRDMVVLYRLTKLFIKLRPDIVHSHTPKAGLMAMIASKLAGIKIRVHTIAGLRFMTSTGFTRWVLIKMEKLTAAFASHVWPNSFSLMRYIREHQLVADRKMEVIGLGSSNGIDLSRFSGNVLQPGKLQKIKEQIGYEEALTYLLCVGRIVKDKGIDELVKAFAVLYESNNRLRLVLVGEFEDKLDPVSDEARKTLQSHPGIILAGWSEDVEYFMSFAHILVHASHREGFPNVLLQAGAMLCPIVCSDIPGNIDIVEHQKTGLLFRVNDKDALLRQLEAALADYESMRQYAKALRIKIEKYFDQPVIHQFLYDKYNELLKARDGSV